MLTLLKGGKREEEGWTLNCGNCFTYVCCPRHTKAAEEKTLELKLVMTEIEKLEGKIQHSIESKFDLLLSSVEQMKRLNDDSEEKSRQSPVITSQGIQRQLLALNSLLGSDGTMMGVE